MNGYFSLAESGGRRGISGTLKPTVRIGREGPDTFPSNILVLKATPPFTSLVFIDLCCYLLVHDEILTLTLVLIQ